LGLFNGGASKKPKNLDVGERGKRRKVGEGSSLDNLKKGWGVIRVSRYSGGPDVLPHRERVGTYLRRGDYVDQGGRGTSRVGVEKKRQGLL